MVDTSLDSWRRTQPTIPTKQELVLRVVSSQRWTGLTCREVEQITRLTHQCVSARIKELLDAGKIRVIGTKEDTTTNRTVRVYAT